jgi:hypothetical protein
LKTIQYEDLAVVKPFYPGGTKAIDATAPVYAFQHQPDNIGNAIIMGDFYRGNTFPVFYDNALFFTDANRGTVTTALFDATGKVTGTRLFADNLFGISQMATGPDGNFYYLQLGDQIGGKTGLGVLGRWKPSTAAAPSGAATSRISVPSSAEGSLIENPVDSNIQKGGLFQRS